MSYFLNLVEGIGKIDDIDHLGNHHIRVVGELLKRIQFRIGLARMERNVRERMSVQDNEVLTPQQIINIRPESAAVKEFFDFLVVTVHGPTQTPLSGVVTQTSFVSLGTWWFDT